MGEAPRYALVGNGRWGGRMRAILAERHEVSCVEGARRLADERLGEYESRLKESFRRTRAGVAWLCVPPGAHVLTMARAALHAGLHVIAEKPWLSSRAETEEIEELAAGEGRMFGVHYQYCLLDAVDAWRREMGGGAGLEFGGSFTISLRDRLGIDALDNLGSHLMAIRAYAVPEARVGSVRCGYEMGDERNVWLEKAGRRVATLDFLGNCEPIVQRFIARVDAATAGAPFLFGSEFALRVAKSVNAVRVKAAG